MANIRHFSVCARFRFQQVPSGAGIAIKGTVEKKGSMLKVERSANGQVIFTLIGRMVKEDIAGLERLFRSESNVHHLILDLKDLTLVDREAVRFLERCEADNIKLNNCPAYIREWITRERRAN